MSEPVTESVTALERTIDLPSMVAYAGATWDWHRMHYDTAWTHAAGLPGPVVDGQMLGALMAEQVLDHFGLHAVVVRLAIRYRSMMFAGDTVRIEGEVAERGEGFVRVAQRATVGDRIVAEGETTVRL